MSKRDLWKEAQAVARNAWIAATGEEPEYNEDYATMIGYFESALRAHGAAVLREEYEAFCERRRQANEVFGRDTDRNGIDWIGSAEYERRDAELQRMDVVWAWLRARAAEEERDG